MGVYTHPIQSFSERANKGVKDDSRISNVRETIHSSYSCLINALVASRYARQVLPAVSYTSKKSNDAAQIFITNFFFGFNKINPELLDHTVSILSLFSFDYDIKF